MLEEAGGELVCGSTGSSHACHGVGLGSGHQLRGGGGGYKTGGGGVGRQVKFYPYKKREGGGKSFSHPEGGGGHNKFWGRFNTGA